MSDGWDSMYKRVYRHFKGSYYQVDFGNARDAGSGNDLVVYHRLSTKDDPLPPFEPSCWVRPLSEWREEVVLSDGTKVLRFAKVDRWE